MKRKFNLLIGFAVLNFLVIPLSKAKTTTDEEKAIAIGHAMSSMMTAINDLNQADFCTMRNALYDTSLDAAQKNNIMNSNQNLQSCRDIIQAAGTTFQNNSLEGMFDDENALWTVVRNTCLTDLGYNLVEWDSRANLDPCAGYKIQTDANMKTFGLCIASVSFGCAETLYAYAICWLAGATMCALSADVTQNAINQSYPNCVGTYKPTGVMWNSWLTIDQVDPAYSCTPD